MAQAGTKQQPETLPQQVEREVLDPVVSVGGMRENSIHRLRLLWNERRFLSRVAVAGLLFGTLLAFLLPKRFESTTQLMPPDAQSTSGMSMLAALSAKTGSGVGAVAGDLLGLKSSGALFIGILRSSTVEDRLVERLGLKKVYGARLEEAASRILAENTAISEDRKSGIITITVTDRDPLFLSFRLRRLIESACFWRRGSQRSSKSWIRPRKNSVSLQARTQRSTSKSRAGRWWMQPRRSWAN